jgi:hypothetical protein
MFNYRLMESKHPEFWGKLQRYKVTGGPFEFEKNQTILIDYKSKSQYTSLPIKLRYTLSNQVELIISSAKSEVLIRVNEQGVFKRVDDKWQQLDIQLTFDPVIELWDNEVIWKQLFKTKQPYQRVIQKFKNWIGLV